MKNSNMAKIELWRSAQLKTRATKGLKGNSVSNKDHAHFQLYRNEDEDGVWYTLDSISYHYVYREGEKHNDWDNRIWDEYKQLFDILEFKGYIHYVYDEWDDHVVGLWINDCDLSFLFTYLHYMNTYKWDLPIILDISVL